MIISFRTLAMQPGGNISPGREINHYLENSMLNMISPIIFFGEWENIRLSKNIVKEKD